MLCEFTLMTSGDYNGAPPTPAPQAMSSRKTSRTASTNTSERGQGRGFRSDMPPPMQPASRRDGSGRLRNPGSRQASTAQAQPARQDSDSLFVPEDEDAAWAPLDYDKEETLGWDASANHDASAFPTFTDSGGVPRTNTTDNSEVFEPTQRVSQIKGLW